MKPVKKEKETGKGRSSWTWQKLAAVAFGVFFVIVMVVSSLGSGWLSGLVMAKPGDTVQIGYTIRDQAGRPVVTTDTQLFNESIQKRIMVFESPYIAVTANMTSSGAFAPLTVYYMSSTPFRFALMSDEMNAISEGLVGLKDGEQKRIPLDMGDPPVYLPNEQLDQYLKNESTLIQPGDQVVFPLSDQPALPMQNTTPANVYYRIFTVINRTADGANLTYGYSYIDVTVLRINNR
jgi:hypothetical protein